MIKINKYENLIKLPRIYKNGTQALVTESHTLYQYKDGEWIPQGGTELQISALELTKQYMENQPVVDEMTIKQALLLLKEYVVRTKNNYYVLMNKDISYWTFFNINNSVHLNSDTIFDQEVIELLMEKGDIVAIDIPGVDDKDTNCYFYIRTKDKEILIFLLFPYDGGTIECTI